MQTFIYGTKEKMQEAFEKNIENKKPGEISRNAIDEELFITGPGGTKKKKNTEMTPEMSQIKKEREALSGVKNLEVDDNSEKVTFLYNDKYTITYEALYDKDKIHISDKNATNPREYSFQFIYSLFGETLETHTTDKTIVSPEDHKNKLIRRLDFCTKSQNMISEELEKEGMRLLGKEKNQYVRGKKFEEEQIHIAVERLLKKGDRGYKKDKEEYVKEYLLFNNGTTPSFRKSNETAFKTAAGMVNIELE